MGANAQIEVPAFTAGQVLTAAEMTQINTGIPVFATTVTRDAAFGGAGEKVLAQGQTCYIEATSTYQTYSGSAWTTFGAGGMPLIIAETAFTGAASVSVNNCFTSTYTNYKLVLNVTVASGSIGIKMRASGTDASTSYYWVNYDMYSSNAAISSTAVGQNVTSMLVAGDDTQAMVEIFNPQLAQATGFAVQGVKLEPTTPRAESTVGNAKGAHNAATAYDGFSLVPATGNITGTYTLYGYAKA
jgi:hypothetical protein